MSSCFPTHCVGYITASIVLGGIWVVFVLHFPPIGKVGNGIPVQFSSLITKGASFWHGCQSCLTSTSSVASLPFPSSRQLINTLKCNFLPVAGLVTFLFYSNLSFHIMSKTFSIFFFFEIISFLPSLPPTHTISYAPPCSFKFMASFH